MTVFVFLKFRPLHQWVLILSLGQTVQPSFHLGLFMSKLTLGGFLIRGDKGQRIKSWQFT